MTPKETIRRKDLFVDEELSILSCLQDRDNPSWKCEPISLGERLANAAIRAMEKHLAENQGPVRGKTE